MKHAPTRRRLRRLYASLFVFTLFKRGTEPWGEGEMGEEFVLLEDEEEGFEFVGIRCPLCKWRPRSTSLWFCGECLEPEGLLRGCGMEWNTFHARGLCPGCNHQWRWTACLSCEGWSLHEDWYEQESDSGREAAR